MMNKIKVNQIELTSRCNATCSYCPQPTMKRKKVDMTRDIFNQALKIIDKDCPPIELHSFGEAFLLGNELFYFLDRMVEENLSWWLSSNGILLGKDLEFDSKLLSYSENTLEISIDNLNPKITIKEKINKINNFLKLSRELNSNLNIRLIAFLRNGRKKHFDWSRIDGVGRDDDDNHESADYTKVMYKKHDWGETDIPREGCWWLEYNTQIIQSNGNIASCCLDALGESATYGDVFNPTFEPNHRWRKCRTCSMGLRTEPKQKKYLEVISKRL